MLDEPSPVELYCAAQVRAIDNQAIRVLGCEGYDLMCTAAAGAFRDLRRHWPQAVRLLVLCGPGNNGGDGFVLARLAAAAGHHVRLCALSPGEALQGDARTAHEQMLEQGGVQMADWHDALPEQHDVVVDALFGTGLRRALQGTAARMVDAVNRARAGAGEAPASPVGVLALDIPSGLCADTGQPLGPTVVADVTSTFVALKRGLFTGRARDHVGRLCFHGLDVPVEAAREQAVQARLLRAESVRGLLPRRAASAHKGRFGHVLALGGNHGYAGAVRLCAEAALRAGAGLVSVGTRAEHLVSTLAGAPEIMCHAIDGNEQLRSLTTRASVIAVGPGLGQSGWSLMLLRAALGAERALVLDADALNLVADDPALAGATAAHSQALVITPHPGEAARLLACSVSEVEADRYAAVATLARRFACAVVLKGAGSLIAAPGRTTAVCEAGNPGMASGGMGDTLTGMVAALLAQGLTAFDAACAAVWLHARSADLAAMRAGQAGLVAHDLLDEARRLVDA